MASPEGMHKQYWSPWICGAILGVASLLCLVLAGRTLGASGGFETIASMIVSALGLPAADSLYFSSLKPPEISFQMIQYIGMIAGAFIGAKISGTFKVRTMPDKQWTDMFGSSVAKRWILMFVGCAIIAFGAGIAGGCTSGLGVGGMMQLAPAGLLFFMGCFGGGIIATRLIYGKRYKK